MERIFWFAYLAALALWLPLALLAVVTPVARRRVAWAIGASAAAALYEGYMTFVWSKTVVAPIRLDAWFLGQALAFLDGVTGIVLWRAAAREAEKVRLRVAALLCLAIPAGVLAGVLGAERHGAQLTTVLDRGRRYRFEAAFRNDETQRRVFGDLSSSAHPWAGYYTGAGHHRHLVVNAERRFWLYGESLYERAGRGEEAAGTFRGRVEDGPLAGAGILLERNADGTYRLQTTSREGRSGQAEPMRRAPPPRFHEASSGAVRFDGVRSAVHGETRDGFWVVQLWLWEAGGRWWGRYLRDHYRPGKRHEFVHAEAIEAECEDACRVLTFRSGRGPVRLVREGKDWVATLDGVPRPVRLAPGETIRGFLLDLAPVKSMEENRRWLEAVTAGQFIRWDAPATPPYRPS